MIASRNTTTADSAAIAGQSLVLVRLLATMAPVAFAYIGTDLISTSDEVFSFVNVLLPIVTCLACLWATYRMIRLSPYLIWSPLPAYLAVSAAYYGIGPLVFFIGSEPTIAHVQALVFVDPNMLLHVNMLNAIGISLVVAGYLFFINRVKPHWQGKLPISPDKYREVKGVLLAFLIIGLPIKYFLLLPYHFGLVNWVLPGSIGSLSILASLAIIPMIWLMRNHHPAYLSFLLLLILSELLCAMMMLSKQAVLTVMIAIMLGHYVSRPGMVTLISWGAAAVVVYMFLTPFVTHGRAELGNPTASGQTDPFAFVRGLGTYVTSKEEDRIGFVEDYQAAFARISYSSTQAFSVDAYDRGVPGDTFELVSYVLIPRILWPDKPIMTVGDKFNVLAFGTDSGASGPGNFATEAYWNGGWPYVVASCLFVGMVFGAFAFFSVRSMTRLNFAMLPVIFMGLIMGLRPDDWFVATYVATPVYAVVLYLVLRVTILPIVKRTTLKTQPAFRT